MKRRIENNKNIQTMEQKDIDIYEILKDEEYGTELYTPICGNVWHSGMANDKDSAKAIWTEDGAGREHFFDKNGKIYKEGEVLLFPSNEMRDWSKFFKKGDVLVSEDGCVHIIFEKFVDYTYTNFIGKHYFDGDDKLGYSYISGRYTANTKQFRIEEGDAVQTYIKTIEEKSGGKLNRETLEIEKPQPEFKEGDVLFVKCQGDNFIEIFKYSKKNGDLFDHASLVPRTQELDTSGKYKISKESIVEIRLATEEEKEQLFSALEKKGKRWDIEKKQIVDLKPAFEIGKLYVFNEDDEDGELTIIGELIAKNESEDTLTFGNQYEIETEKFVTDQAFDLRISVNKELREATENEVELFNKHYAIWKKEKEEREQPAFKTFDKVLVSNGEGYNWQPAFFVSDRGEGASYRYKVLLIEKGRVSDFTSCIPYNEETKHLLRTTYEWKGGK